MASSYALPHDGSPYHSRGHSYSSNTTQASPKRSHPRANGNSSFSGHVRHAGSNGSLYTHAEASHEGTPAHSPYDEADYQNIASDYNKSAAIANGSLYSQEIHHNNHNQHNHSHGHSHSHSHFSTPMKARPRGESDLGRPAAASTYRPSLESIPAASPSWFSLPEALTSLLIPLPYLLASAAYLRPVDDVLLSDSASLQLSALARLQKAAQDAGHTHSFERSGYGLVEACSLTSGTLLLVGLIAKMRSSEKMLDRRKDKFVASRHAESLYTLDAAKKMAGRSLAVALPFYAATQIGGMRTGSILLVAVAAGMTHTDTGARLSLHDWRHIIKTRKATMAVLLVSILLDSFEITTRAPILGLLTGYLALASSLLFLPTPLPTSAAIQSSSDATPTATTFRTPWSQPVVSPLISSPAEVNVTLAAGAVTIVLTLITSIILRTVPPSDIMAIVFGALSLAVSSAAILFTKPSTIRSQHKTGVGLGCLLIAITSFIFSPSLWPGTVCNSGLALLSYLGVSRDTAPPAAHKHDDHDHVHDHAHNATTSHKVEGKHSFFTAYFLDNCEPGSLAHGILSEKDSRRIAYFTCLNFGFMLVQGVYGYLSGSLGLLSDTVHMFFDCLGLVIGLGAAVASKWPTSPEKPYGWGKLNTLAGFGNGIFLMLVSVEFVWEAMEGIMEQKEIRRVEELLVVSTMGFVVNMIGLFAFGHAHHGHDHGHGHGHSHGHDDHAGHSHGHDHGHDHSHDHSHGHAHDHSQDHSHDHAHAHDHSHTNGHTHGHHTRNLSTASHLSQLSHTSVGSTDTFQTAIHTPTVTNGDITGYFPPSTTAPAHSHSHAGHDHHHNENMHGIFLHIAADAGGSLAVIVSTAMTLWKPWYGWDPLATILIAILIFAAAVPLVSGSARKLLLVVPDDLEWGIKEMLQGLREERGVVGYSGVRFWVDDREEGVGDGVGENGVVKKRVGGGPRVMGVVHVIASPVADLEDVRGRVEDFVGERGMDCVVHVEREGDECWCGGGGQF
ncbi:unnamed protein product [Zymoseptoria tritici ST99CH_3D7]|uniref:Zinc transporter n=1 Tax=Zymoseptoria tritici (strain ST99CH_3D7) TaxID=1276538 RepID=A0A1X7RVY0_ZYMT9|nr:unnamed protein product [Zymoseptoria tritici ST99CH_3D7]